MNYGCCLVCKTPIESGAVVVAEVFGGLPVSFAHAQCFIESAMPATFIDPRQTVLVESGFGMDAIGARAEMNLPRRGVEPDMDYRLRLLAKMHWMRGEGSSMAICNWDDFHRFDELLKRGESVEIDGLKYFVVGVDFETRHGRGTVNFMPRIPAELVPGLSAHEWRGPMYGTKTTAPEGNSEPRPNHVRDAVRANQ